MPEFGETGSDLGNTHPALRIPESEVLMKKRKRGDDGQFLKSKIHKRCSGDKNPNSSPEGELGKKDMVRFLVEIITKGRRGCWGYGCG